METPTADKIVEIELSKLRKENQLILDDNLTPFSLKVRDAMNKSNSLLDSPVHRIPGSSNTLDAFNLELIEFPKFEDFKPISERIVDKEDDEEEEDVAEVSTDTSDVRLDSLGIEDSPLVKTPNYKEIDLLKIFDTNIKNADLSLEEFPIYNFQPKTDQVIDNEEVLKTPEILKITKHNAKSSSPRKRSPTKKAAPSLSASPTKKPITASTLKKSKSKIPLPTTSLATEVRRSKRLEELLPAPSKHTCSPKKGFSNSRLRPILRIRSKNSLNLIVDASTGLLTDATQYATEINATNGDGVPIPQTTNEQVTVPVNGPRRTKAPKSAIVRGFIHKIPSVKYNGEARIGFYSEADQKKYFNPKDSPVKVQKPQSNASPSKKGRTKKRSVRWAEQLEW